MHRAKHSPFPSAWSIRWLFSNPAFARSYYPPTLPTTMTYRRLGSRMGDLFAYFSNLNQIKQRGLKKSPVYLMLLLSKSSSSPFLSLLRLLRRIVRTHLTMCWVF